MEKVMDSEFVPMASSTKRLMVSKNMFKRGRKKRSLGNVVEDKAAKEAALNKVCVGISKKTGQSVKEVKEAIT